MLLSKADCNEERLQAPDVQEEDFLSCDGRDTPVSCTNAQNGGTKSRRDTASQEIY